MTRNNRLFLNLIILKNNYSKCKTPIKVIVQFLSHSLIYCRCTCFNCVSMPSVEESICCNEIDQVADKKGENLCIIGHPGFEGGCLNVYALQIAYYAYRQNHGHYEGATNERYRYTAYRQLARWCWAYLGKYVRVPLPSCAVQRIREEFPSFDYVGFRAEKEPPSLDL